LGRQGREQGCRAVKLFQRASANSKAQKGEYDPATANEDATAAEGMYVKGYTY